MMEPEAPVEVVHNHQQATEMKTPVPSDVEQAKILMAQTLRKDKKKPTLWAARFVLMPLMLMIYTIGFFLNSDEGAEDDSTIAGDFRLFDGQDWSYPKTMRLAGFDNDFVTQVGQVIDEQLEMIDLQYTGLTNASEFKNECQVDIAWSAGDEVCVFVDAVDSFSLYYGGKEEAAPFQPSLAAAQWALSSALLDVSNATQSYPVDQIQRTPRLVNDESIEANVASLLVPAMMHVLSAAITLQFLTGPISFEKINGVTKSFLLVGVKMRTYLLQWLAYYSLNGLITAGLLTIVAVFWNLFPLSSPGLIFISHFFGLVQVYAKFVLLIQFIEQEELAQGMPWLEAIASMAIGAAVVIVGSPESLLLTLLTILFPFVGIIQYYGIYITYDATGFDTGIHVGENVGESGLLASLIAQVIGILFRVGAILLYASPQFSDWLGSTFGRKQAEEETPVRSSQEEEDDHPDNFEPIAPGAEILVSVRGVQHTYQPGFFNCDKNKKPVEVLQGLDMDICRGEVFCYLGHNGAGSKCNTVLRWISLDVPLLTPSCPNRPNERDHFDQYSSWRSEIARRKCNVPSERWR
jgi:hypothetical protein